MEREEALVESELNEQKILVQVGGGTLEHLKERPSPMGQEGCDMDMFFPGIRVHVFSWFDSNM